MTAPVTPAAPAGLSVVTFGCRLNADESERAREAAAAAGLSDAVIVNTCAVTSEAVRQARQAIRRARRERPGAAIVVTGCAAQIDPEAFAALDAVDLVLGNALKSDPAAYGPSAFTRRVNVPDIFSETRILSGPSGAARAPEAGAGRRRRVGVEIQNGCDHRCTFCIIPFGRGGSRSAPVEEAVRRVRRAQAAGAEEVVLTGVDLTSWGRDLGDGSDPQDRSRGGQPRSLGELVAGILRACPDLPQLRLSSIDAAELDDDLLRCFAEEPRLAPFLHLSLQSGDDMILKRMKRRHLRGDALALVERVRRARPETAFGADLIAGFPTETEERFQNTVRLIAEAGLSYVHVFPFSPRPGTPAARMPPVAPDVVKTRAERLRGEARRALGAHLQSRLGRTVPALVEAEGRARAADFTEIAFTPAPVHPGSPTLAAASPWIELRLLAHDGRRAFGVNAAEAAPQPRSAASGFSLRAPAAT